MHGADAKGGGAAQGGALGLRALARRDGGEGGGAHPVVGVAGQRGVRAEAGAPVMPGTRSSSAVVATAEWTSMRER